MDAQKYTQRSLQMIQDAQNIAIKNGNPEITDLHLHKALVTDSDSLIARVLQEMNVDINQYRMTVEREVDMLPQQQGASQVYPNTIFQRILLKAEDEAKALGDSYISVEHLYLSLISERKIPSEQIIHQFGITGKKFLSVLNEIRGSRKVTSDNPEETEDVLEKYGN